MVGAGLQVPVSCDGGQSQGDFGKGEDVADAFAGSTAQGNEGVARRGASGGPPIRVEAVGVGVEVRPVMDEVRTKNEGGSGGNGMCPEPGIGGGLAGQDIDGLAIAPGPGHGGDLPEHCLGVAGKTGVMEGGLQQPPLSPTSSRRMRNQPVNSPALVHTRGPSHVQKNAPGTGRPYRIRHLVYSSCRSVA